MTRLMRSTTWELSMRLGLQRCLTVWCHSFCFRTTRKCTDIIKFSCPQKTMGGSDVVGYVVLSDTMSCNTGLPAQSLGACVPW